ncbi:MAG: MFS transporter [Acidimicrobiales bacterium]
MTESPLLDNRLLGEGRRPVVVAVMSLIAIASYNNLSATAALPDIGDDLGDIGLLPFVITLELLTSAVAVLAAGAVVDSLGARRVYRVATVGFVVMSLTVAAAPTMPLLLAARAVQGIFAGALMTVGVASIGLAIPARLRPKAFAFTSSVWGVMGVAGPAIAAIFVATVGWRAIFVVNVPVTVIAAALGWHRIPDRQDGAPAHRVDRVGLALVAAITTAALALATYSPVVIAIALATLALAVPLYVRWAHRTPDPVVRLPHLLEPRYRTVHVTSMAVLAGGVGANSFLPLYLRTTRGQSTGVAAFGVMFLTVGWTASAYVASWLQERWRGEWVSLLGSAIATTAVVFTAACVHLDAPVPVVYAAFFSLGAGVGMVTSTGAALLQSRTRPAEMGRVTGAHQFLRTIALTLGIAAVGAITLAVVDARTGDIESVRDLLSGDDVAVPVDLLDSISDGYAIAIAALAVVVAASIPSALRLVRTRDQALASAP